MKIAVLGAGAMGMLIGGSLSKANTVTLVDVNRAVVDTILKQGVRIHEKDGTVQTMHPSATFSTAGMQPVDLVIVFVKAMFSEGALQANRQLIGPDTYVMTLQNGAGHEETLLRFVDRAHVVIGTTQHNSSIVALGEISHGGAGHTYLGSLTDDVQRIQHIADAFMASGLSTSVDDNVQKLIWSKMFTNVSASVLTGVLQCPLGFIVENENAWSLCSTLVQEAVQVANAAGMNFDFAQKLDEVRKVCENAPQGYTSIYADLRDGRKSEVDTISGAVAKAGMRTGVSAPTHACMVWLVHAMERRNEILS